MTAYVKPEMEVMALRAEERVAACQSQYHLTGPSGTPCDNPQCWTITVDES